MPAGFRALRCFASSTCCSGTVRELSQMLLRIWVPQVIHHWRSYWRHVRIKREESEVAMQANRRSMRAEPLDKRPLRKQVIKITYQNDTLIGTKIYGDQVVPSGEVIFQVRVSPESKRPDPIDVQHVTDPRLKKLERFTGSGVLVEDDVTYDTQLCVIDL